jgi:hypothetical protein
MRPTLFVQNTTTGLTTGNLTNTANVEVDTNSGQGGSTITIGRTLVSIRSWVAWGRNGSSREPAISWAMDRMTC